MDQLLKGKDILLDSDSDMSDMKIKKKPSVGIKRRSSIRSKEILVSPSIKKWQENESSIARIPESPVKSEFKRQLGKNSLKSNDIYVNFVHHH